MKAQPIVEIHIREFYETQRRAFIDKMKSEEDERSNLKFKIASFVIHELSYTSPAWFVNHFLTSIATLGGHTESTDPAIASAEKAFHESVAAWLIKLESDVDHVKQAMNLLTDEEAKGEYWRPIVADAFLIAGIYLVPPVHAVCKPLTTDTSDKPTKTRCACAS